VAEILSVGADPERTVNVPYLKGETVTGSSRAGIATST
jgi:hypothetical protein